MKKLLFVAKKEWVKFHTYIWGDRITRMAELFDHHALEEYCNSFAGKRGESHVLNITGSSRFMKAPLSIGHCTTKALLSDKTISNHEFAVLIPDCTVYCKNFVVLAAGNLLVNKFSHFPTNEPGTHRALHQQYFGTSKFLKGKSLLIRGGVWYHFICEGLPVIYLSGKAGHALDSFDHIIVYGELGKEAKKMLEYVGVNMQKLVELNDEKRGFRCAELFISDPYLHDERYFRQFFQQVKFKVPKSERNFSKRLYVSRAKTKFRRVINENEVSSLLSGTGFETILNEELTLEEQIKAYAGADIIISPHGANLANLVFCNAGAKVVEIRFSGHEVHKETYWNIANIMQLDYAVLYSERGRSVEGIVRSDRDVDNSDMYVDLNDLKSLVGSFCKLPVLFNIEKNWHAENN